MLGKNANKRNSNLDEGKTRLVKKSDIQKKLQTAKVWKRPDKKTFASEGSRGEREDQGTYDRMSVERHGM